MGESNEQREKNKKNEKERKSGVNAYRPLTPLHKDIVKYRSSFKDEI